MANKLKILKIIFLFFAIFVVLSFTLYIFVVPSLIENVRFVKSVEKFINNTLKLELKIENPKLKTSLKPFILFSVDKLTLIKNKNLLIDLENFKTKIEFDDIFEKEIELEFLEAKKVIVDINEVLNIFPKVTDDNSRKKSDWKFQFLNSDITLTELSLFYSLNNSKIKAYAKDIVLNDGNLGFDFSADIFKRNKKYVSIKCLATDEIKFLDDSLKIEKLKVFVNKSWFDINSKIDNKNILVNVQSDKFLVKDVFDVVNSDAIITNGESMLSPLVFPNGKISFDINLNNLDLNGDINLDNTNACLKDLNKLPLNITKGKIKIFKDKITFQNLIGYYGKNKQNKIEVKGDIKDYYKTFDSNIEVETLITNEFFKDYLSNLINNTVLYVSKPSRTKIIYKSKNNIMDIIWFAQISKGVDFGVTTEKSALSDYDRAVLGEFRIKDNKIDVKNINYYIASNIIRGVKLQPILQVSALMDFAGNIDRAGFAFGREMPCEFLNVFAGQKLFKKGTIKGNINVEFKNNIPYLISDMEIANTFIPSQRLFLKSVILKSDSKIIDINVNGRFKRAKYNFSGKIKNGFKPPFVVKKLDLNLDNVDVEKFLATVNNQNSNLQKIDENKIANENDIQDDDFMFDTSLVRIEDCDFSLEKGKYKDLNFGNIKAKLTLDENGILDIKSNKFDIAQGFSTLKVNCDLKKLKYYIKLGVRNVDSNLMAKTLLNLDKEITGKASGIIELNTDSSMMMNGEIKFLVNDGTIGKIGLVEYVLKIASVFRNPIVMISPATIVDIVSIPEGKFDKISGVLKLKNNVVYNIDIKSYSKSLSALIRGRFDMNLHDASLRIYTRFSNDKNSMFGFLRSLSLNALANKVQMNSINDENY